MRTNSILIKRVPPLSFFYTPRFPARLSISDHLPTYAATASVAAAGDHLPSPSRLPPPLFHTCTPSFPSPSAGACIRPPPSSPPPPPVVISGHHFTVSTYSFTPLHPYLVTPRSIAACVASVIAFLPRGRTSPGVPSSSSSPPIQPVSPSEETKSVPFIGAGIPAVAAGQTRPIEVFPPPSPPTRGRAWPPSRSLPPPCESNTTVAGSVFRLLAGIAAPPARQVWSRHPLPLCRDRRHLPPLPNVTSRRQH